MALIQKARPADHKMGRRTEFQDRHLQSERHDEGCDGYAHAGYGNI